MPARPIHRFSADDRYFRGARVGNLTDLKPGSAAIFGLGGYDDAARSIRDASWALDEAPPTNLVDLGDTTLPSSEAASTIVGRRGRPFLLAGGIESAVSVLSECSYDIAIAISATLPFLPSDLKAAQLISVGLHDLVPAKLVRAWRNVGAHFVTATGSGDFEKRLSDTLGNVVKGKNAVLLLDSGVVDTGHAAATASVNVGGLSALEAIRAIEIVGQHFKISGFAAVGLNADLDPRGHSELLVAAAVNSAAGTAERS